MKLKIFFILVIFQAGNSYSQTLPNMSFDSWTSYSGGAYEEPSGDVWTTANKSTLLTSLIPVTTEKTTDTVAGPFAAKMTTKLAPLPINPLLVTGTLATGTFNYLATPPANLKMGTPFTGRPVRFTGYYKYIDNAGDSCDIYAILSKWDGSAHQTVGDARLRSTLTVTQYTKFDLAFNYYSADTPDSISIVFASSAAGNLMQGNVGSTLYIDNTSLEYTNGFETILDPAIQVNCYPVPATTTVNFSLNKVPGNGILKIYGETGTEVKSVKVVNKETTVSVGGLAAGKYFYKIINNTITLSTGWFIVE